ncbi:hypothetical protein BDV32DRAFT_137730 [Aspergillus pseudonomiae]|uniref:DUF7605 domain-containing protein n=1 Tax=Aspergillus pseudonomiae TaxID=1506151 RepID=A0A5N6I5N6_9EURO|nr:uncharacterized protein BDV37DRAFT_272092 [Aspergillus pseudonomiae]KAB8261079.1 hypothetical protein BDV32DRAFT_137730 [Aspergillus pseudonomiae]KAE8403494.1 hypothetical protein BDV37DRAFT_272092 [Aspergillus pseudonomiae]
MVLDKAALWGTSPQGSNFSTLDFNFRAIIPSVEVAADEDPPSSSIQGGQTSSASDSGDSSHRGYTPSQSTATPRYRENLSLGVAEPLRTLNLQETPTSHRTPSWRHDARRQSTGLSPGRSTSTYGRLFNATPEPSPEPSRVQSTLNRDSTVDGLASDLEDSHLNDDGPLSDDSDQLSEIENEDDATDSDGSSLYNVRRERLPRAPIYNADLQEILRGIKSQLSALQNYIDRSPLSRDRDSDLFQLREKVRMLNELECPETRTVGFIGNSGVGKSRLINSLLDQEGLARSSGDGAACTSVVTEFRHTDARHPDRYTIEVDYMDEEEVKELLEELVQSFRMYYTDLYREVTSIEEQERIRDRSTRAWSTLNSLFRDQPELTHEFLSDQTDDALSRILEQLGDWAAQSCTRRPGGAALQHTIIPSNVQECRSQLDMLTMDPRDESEVAIWPFIKLIRENQEDAKLELDRFLVEGRSLRVTNQLLRNHGAEVRVFCISNEWYSQYRQDANRHADTYIGLSGIRELRRYCQLVPADAQFRFTAAFIKHRVPAVVRSVRQWVLAGSDDVTVERAVALRQVLRDVENVFRERLILRNSEVRGFPRRLEDRFHDDILSVSYERFPIWKRCALQTSRTWECWHHMTYSAFCRNYGTHSTKAANYRCWNEELLEGMRFYLKERWESIQGWVSIQKLTLGEAVRRAFEENKAQIEDIMHLAPLALENFIDNMDDWENSVIAAINQSLNQLLQELSHLTNSNLFPNLTNISEAQFRASVREICQEMRRMVGEQVGNICDDLHSIIAEEGEVTEARRFPEMARTLQLKVDTAQATLERAQRIVDELENAPE